MITVAADALTYVDLIWIEKRVQRWIRFGRVVSEQIVDPHRSIVAFAPGDGVCPAAGGWASSATNAAAKTASAAVETFERWLMGASF